MEIDTPLSEVNGGLSAKPKCAIQTNLTKHAHRETGLIAIHIRVPLLSACRVYISVILKFYVHHIQSYEKAIVQEAAVQIRTVLDDRFLGYGDAAAYTQREEE
jgi:hypothetical protein